MQLRKTQFLEPEEAILSGSFGKRLASEDNYIDQAERSISTTRLNALLHLHL